MISRAGFLWAVGGGRGAGIGEVALAWLNLSRVRSVSRDSDFRAQLELDQDGLVVAYEHLAERATA